MWLHLYWVRASARWSHRHRASRHTHRCCVCPAITLRGSNLSVAVPPAQRCWPAQRRAGFLTCDRHSLGCEWLEAMNPVSVPFLSSTHASSVVTHGHLMTAVHLSFIIYSLSLTPDSKKRTPVALYNWSFIRIICKYILSISGVAQSRTTTEPNLSNSNSSSRPSLSSPVGISAHNHQF